MPYTVLYSLRSAICVVFYFLNGTIEYLAKMGENRMATFVYHVPISREELQKGTYAESLLHCFQFLFVLRFAHRLIKSGRLI